MNNFDGNHPKYHTCCCGIHVTKLAHFFMSISLVLYMFELFTEMSEGKHGKLMFIPIAFLGAYGVFNEARIPLLLYIALGVVYCILWIIYFLVGFSLSNSTSSWDYIDDDHIIPAAVFVCIVFAIIQFCIYKTYWNFAQFLKDREAHQQGLVLYQVVMQDTTTAVPSAPPVYEAPPPYYEK